MNKLKNNIIWAGVLFAQILFFYFFSGWESGLFYHEKFFELQKSFHQKLFSWSIFSLGDILYLALIFTLLRWGYFRFKGVKSSRPFLIGVNIFYFIYQIFWGLLYFQPPLKEKLSSDEFHREEVEQLTLKYLQLCKVSRREVLENEKGIFKIQNLEKVKQDILQNQSKIPQDFRIKTATKIISFKPSLFSSVMSFTGILGYYNPFTTEAQYNPNLPDTYLPFTLAHESAHQLGFAREQEANFIGYLLGGYADNKDLKYSTQWFVLKSLLRFQIEENPKFVEYVFEDFSEEMKRDYMAEKLFYEQHTGKIEYFFSTINDWFLKSNQQEGSITYDYFVDLLISYELKKDRICKEYGPKKHK